MTFGELILVLFVLAVIAAYVMIDKTRRAAVANWIGMIPIAFGAVSNLLGMVTGAAQQYQLQNYISPQYLFAYFFALCLIDAFVHWRQAKAGSPTP